MSVRIVGLPPELPRKWDLADDPPGGLDLKAILLGATVLQSGLRPFIITAADFVKLPIPKREFVVEPFLPTSSLSMIFAARGLGKTWFALSLCLSIASGDDFIRFTVPKARIVLFVDGEMALKDLQERIAQLDEAPPANLLVLPSESLFREDRPLNIHLEEDQTRVEEALAVLTAEGRRPEVIVFDNLSSLSGGVDENDNSALDALLKWLVGLRHKGFAALLVHHAGKSGDQRGASRREDLLDTSIKLKKPPEDKDDDAPPPSDGAHFIAEFVKTRGKMPNPPEIDLELVAGEFGKLEWSLGHGVNASVKDKALKVIALSEPRTQQDLARLLDVTAGRVSQLCKGLRKYGLIGEGVKITDAGRERVLAVWPELSMRLARQDNIPV